MTDAELIRALRDSVLLVALTDEQLAEFARIGTTEVYEPGQVLLGKGELGDNLYLILKGEVVVGETTDEVIATLSGNRTLHEQYEGDFFGEMAILDYEPRSATVRAVTQVKVFRVERESLHSLFAGDVDLQVVMLTNMARTLSRRLRLANIKAGSSKENA